MAAVNVRMLAAALGRFRERFPDVEVMVKEISPNEQGAAIVAGDIRVGFALSEHLALESGLDSCTVIDFRMGVAVSPEHPLATRKRLRATDLIDQDMICVGHAHRSEHARYTRDLLSTNGVVRPRVRGVTGFGALMTMVASGHGIAFMPHALSADGPGQIVVIPFEAAGKPVDFELRAAWLRADESPMVKNFVRTLRRFSKSAAA